MCVHRSSLISGFHRLVLRLDHSPFHLGMSLPELPNLCSCSGDLLLKIVNVIASPIVILVQATKSSGCDLDNGPHINDLTSRRPGLVVEPCDVTNHDMESPVG